jgi:hypothetical protein
LSNRSIYLGRLFFGTQFDAMKGDAPPSFIDYIDTVVPMWFLHCCYKLKYVGNRLLQLVPVKSSPTFLRAGSGVYEASLTFLTPSPPRTFQIPLPLFFRSVVI